MPDAATSRRRLLAGAAALAAGAATSGCGFVPTGATPEDDLTFTTWGTDAELAGFRAAIRRFEQSHRGRSVQLNAVPYEQMFTNIDAQIQAGNPPDVFRVPYYTFGAYAGRKQLLDLTPHLPAGFADRFTPAAWAAVQSGGRPYGVPHHTDTSVLLFNKEALSSAGIPTPPTRIEETWSWEQFEQVARTLRQKLPEEKYPFAVNWQGNGVTRWLSWLFQAGGRFLQPDLVSAAIESDAGRQALRFTQAFFPDKLVPPNSSVKSTTLAADLWYGETVAMSFGGAFQIPDALAAVDFDWGATFAPRDVRAGGDFGGNALVATAHTPKPELAASFLSFVTESREMRSFCRTASLLPTRRDLVATGIEFKHRNDLADVFLGQAGTVQASDSGQVASPSMSGIITVLQQELEQAFANGRGVDTTLRRISEGIEKATAS